MATCLVPRACAFGFVPLTGHLFPAHESIIIETFLNSEMSLKKTKWSARVL
jgi:hypothetical protein